MTTWPKDYSRSQMWCVRSTGTGHYYINTYLSNAYALDYYWGSSNPGNCDLYSITVDGTWNKDAFVTFISEASSDYSFGIKTESHALYLTEVLSKPIYYGNESGYDVRWQSATYESTPSSQVWFFDWIDQG